MQDKSAITVSKQQSMFVDTAGIASPLWKKWLTEGCASIIISFAANFGELCNGSTYDSDSYCLGSNPSSPAIWLHGQAVKTSPSQGENRGSIPLGAAIRKAFNCNELMAFFFPQSRTF